MEIEKIFRKNDPPVSEKHTLPKVATGVAGLDAILEGGVPKNRTTLIGGGPGTGKTVFGFDFLNYRIKKGEPGIFVAFEERAEAIRRNMASFGWDLNAFEKEGKLFLMEARLDPETVLSGEFDLTGLMAILQGKAAAMGAKTIIIDALDMLLFHLNDPVRQRREVYMLHDWLTNQGITAILTVKTTPKSDAFSQYAFMDFMADCVIHLEQHVDERMTSKRLRVIKYRGSDFGNKEYAYAITSRGIQFVPVSSVSLEYKPLGGRVTSGIPRLDALLHGGFRTGSTVLIAGSTGAGKTTMACSYALSACEAGLKTFYIGFEESDDAILDAMLSSGIDLRPAVASGLVRFECRMPESIGIEKHLIETLQSLEAFAPHSVVIDAISACKRMGQEKSAFNYLVRLVNFCKHRGITCLMVNQTSGFSEVHDISGIGVSSLMDAIVFLHFREENWSLKRALLVMKARGSMHSERYHEYRITDRGIDIMGPMGADSPKETGGGES